MISGLSGTSVQPAFGLHLRVDEKHPRLAEIMKVAGELQDHLNGPEAFSDLNLPRARWTMAMHGRGVDSTARQGKGSLNITLNPAPQRALTDEFFENVTQRRSAERRARRDAKCMLQWYFPKDLDGIEFVNANGRSRPVGEKRMRAFRNGRY
ncbi:MAG: hypothetical protein AB7P76_00810 [Candidatus Melainabacteria bacterium]